MSVDELKKYILKSKYARYNHSEKRRETYDEAVNRVRDMMHTKYPRIPDVIDWAYDEVLRETALGSQRAMQYGGEPILRKSARIYNCCSSYADRLRFFQEAFWLLLCGCGVGFSVQKHHVARLPNFGGREVERVRNPFCMVDSIDTAVFVIPDSIEGWGDSLGVLISAYFPGGPFPEYFGRHVQFDPRLIRLQGSLLSSGAGRAPGPQPLINALVKIRNLLDECIIRGQSRLRPIDVYDIEMHSSDAVLAGGVRRSATICIFSPDDEEMADAKTGDWIATNPQRARSNNSALLVRNTTSFDQFKTLMERTQQYGEPGFAWADSTEWIPNACTEIGFWPALRLTRDSDMALEVLDGYQGPLEQDTGSSIEDNIIVASGWQHCNLSTINGSMIETPGDFYRGCRIAATLGTLQAGFTDFAYLGRVSEEIVRKEALLGVSITSIMSNPRVMLDPGVLRRGARIVLDTNEEIAGMIGINPAARSTCIKPEGTSTLMLGSLASGCHGWPFQRGIRNVQANRDEVVYNWFKRSNPEACRRSVWCANGSTDVMSFPVEAPEGSLLHNDMTAVEFLDVVKNLYLNWVVPGKRPERCTQPWLNHSVSNTVKVKDHEWEGVTRHIFDNRDCFAGISLLPFCGDKDYEQAPNVAVYDYGEMAEIYGAEAVDAAGQLLGVIGSAYECSLWEACRRMTEGLQGESEYQKFAHVGFRKLADRYLGGDRQKVTHLLKDIYAWELYVRLKETFVPVDYESLIEAQDDTRPEQEVACSGGACSLS